MCRRPKLSAERADHHNVIGILAFIVRLAGMAGTNRRTTPRSEPRDEAHTRPARQKRTHSPIFSVPPGVPGPCFAPVFGCRSYSLRRITDGTHPVVWRHTGAWQRRGMGQPLARPLPRSGRNVSLSQKYYSPEGLLTVDTKYRWRYTPLIGGGDHEFPSPAQLSNCFRHKPRH
jgi:hypothetical protein